jgi:prephenate dehydrogenase
MGRLLRSMLEPVAAGPVRSLDKPLRDSELDRVIPSADLVLLAVPLPALDEVLRRLAPRLAPTTLLADIASVKTRPLELMLRAHQGPVAGTHPLFGPDPDPGTARRIAVVPGRCEHALHELEGLLAAGGMQPLRTDAAAHDRSMAYIHGLNFATSVSFLAASSLQPDLEKFATPSFRRRLEAARKMLVQDGGLFCEAFEANPYSREAVRTFRSLLNLASSGELDLLRERAMWWWRSLDPEEGAF